MGLKAAVTPQKPPVIQHDDHDVWPREQRQPGIDRRGQEVRNGYAAWCGDGVEEKERRPDGSMEMTFQGPLVLRRASFTTDAHSRSGCWKKLELLAWVPTVDFGTQRNAFGTLC